MRKVIVILGIMLTPMVLISGPVVAGTWHFAESVDFQQKCTDANESLDQPDSVHATVGHSTPSSELGILRLDLGSGNHMGHGTYFYVYASSTVSENYSVTIYNIYKTTSVSVGNGEDTNDHTFKTPDTPPEDWRYIEIHGLTGSIGAGDPVNGPEVDAVGWYEP